MKMMVMGLLLASFLLYPARSEPLDDDDADDVNDEITDSVKRMNIRTINNKRHILKTNDRLHDNPHKQTNMSKMSKKKSKDGPVYSLSKDRNVVGAKTKLSLIQKAVDELKSVLNKRTVSASTKSSVLSNIFDAQGDPQKASLANEILRKALEPAKPTNGAVGDLGAEMIKVSIVSRRKYTPRKHHRFSRTRKINNTRNNEKSPLLVRDQTNKTVKETQPQVRLRNEKINFEQDYDKSNSFRNNTKSIQNLVRLKKITSKLRKLNATLSRIISRKQKHFKYKFVTSGSEYRNSSHPRRFSLVQVGKEPPINMTGKSAKLVSVKLSSSKSRVRDLHSTRNITNIRQTRKDYVIELDDDQNYDDTEPDDNVGQRRGFTPIMSLLNRFVKTNNGDVAIIDDRGDDDRYNNPNDLDDGFITPNRRRFGENLFLSSFSDENEEDESDTEPGFQRSFQPEDDDDDDMYESRLEPQIERMVGDGGNDYETPAIYEQDYEDNFINNQKSGNPFSMINNSDKPIIMEMDKKKKRYDIPPL